LAEYTVSTWPRRQNFWPQSERTPTREQRDKATHTEANRIDCGAGRLELIGIVVAIFWSVVLGVIIALIGLIAFGGFARGRWY
jgi:hypothetical protein